MNHFILYLLFQYLLANSKTLGKSCILLDIHFTFLVSVHAKRFSRLSIQFLKFNSFFNVVWIQSYHQVLALYRTRRCPRASRTSMPAQTPFHLLPFAQRWNFVISSKMWLFNFIIDYFILLINYWQICLLNDYFHLKIASNFKIKTNYFLKVFQFIICWYPVRKNFQYY